MKNNKKNKTIILIIFSIISLILLSTIVYSAFSSTMNITGTAHTRVEANVRITDFSIKDTTNSSISMYESFTKNTISSSVQLQPNSSITYNLEITNYGSTNVGIFNITGLPSGVNYSIENYNLKDMICDDTGKCNSFAKKNYALTISTISSSYEGALTLTFDFRIFHNVSYTNFNGSYTKNIIDGDTINIDLSYDSPKLVLVTSDKYINYNYSNNTLYLENVISDLEIESINTTTYNFDYTGGVQEFTAPYDGTYRLNAWGAQGGSYDTYYGGYGAFTTGEINLKKGEKIYIYVGGAGKTTDEYDASLEGGYNGGGSSIGAWSSADDASEVKQSGGGATHFSFEKNILQNEKNLDSLITVAAGGSGSVYFHYEKDNLIYAYCYGGHGGGITGGVASCDSNLMEYLLEYSPATQEKPGISNYNTYVNTGKLGAGGDGYAGGGSGFYGGAGNYLGAGGGSSYIGNSNLKQKAMYCYECETSNETNTKTYSTTNVSSSPIVNYAKQGNGYATIEILSTKKTYSIDYIGINGTYISKIEAGNDLIINFGSNAPTNISVFENEINYSNYNYSNGILTIPEVKGDIVVAAAPYTKTFKYTGNYQQYFVPVDGKYKIELWGAGGGGNNEYPGGRGGYVSGKISLAKGEKLYVYVGENGINSNSTVFNGGSYTRILNNGTIGYSGGGATDVRLTSGTWNNFNSLKSRIMVAGAGGGSNTYYSATAGASAGGLIGYSGLINEIFDGRIATGGTQTTGGLCGLGTYLSETEKNKFGLVIYRESRTSSGGNGYYAGGNGAHGSGTVGSGAGGSSFISGHNGCDAITGSSTEDTITHTGKSIHYSGYQFTDTVMIDGEGYNWTTEKGAEVVGMPTFDGTSTMIGNEGDGYAKITLIEAS